MPVKKDLLVAADMASRMGDHERAFQVTADVEGTVPLLAQSRK